MRTFKQFLESKSVLGIRLHPLARLLTNYEMNESVYRIDSDRVDDFSKNLRTYYHNRDWTHSGTFQDPRSVPDGYQQAKGLFGDTLRNVVPYAVPRNTPWILHYLRKRPTLVFNEKDKQAIASHRPHLSTFPDQQFSRLPSGEMFSTNPGTPTHQEPIRKPLNFIKRWYDVEFVPDLKTVKRHFKRQGVLFDSEGLN
jgi:hypothetical protein